MSSANGIAKREMGCKVRNLYTLKVFPSGLGRDVYRIIEVSGEYTLDDLCEAILSAFDFIHEHLYEFCMDNRMYSDNSYQSNPEDDEPSTRVKLDKLDLELKQKFSLHYDFGDDWMFTIAVQKIAVTAERVSPTVIKQKGSIEQYPEWDEEDEDYG